MTKIALIGFGEVGQTLAEDLHTATEITAWDIQFENPTLSPSKAANALGINTARSAADAAQSATIVFSAVTAAQTKAAAQNAAQAELKNSLYIDLNSASPGTKMAAADIINAAGGRYVEASIMSPIAPKRTGSPILLGGPHIAEAQRALTNLGFSGSVMFDTAYGKTAAAKMCRSIMVKGLEALLSEGLLAARHYGVEETVLTSLNDLFPGLQWPTLARYMISRTIEHGTRRAEEMEEAAQTVAQAGLDAPMAHATVERQNWAAQFNGLEQESDLLAMLDAMLKAKP